MKIVEVASLALEDVRVVRFARFPDKRGYFTETFRVSDLLTHPAMTFLQGMSFVQMNESYSRAGTVRGLHFQWNPPMGKLVRPLSGRLIDIALDVRKGSPTRGKAVMYDMPSTRSEGQAEWIWLPPGFAHGTCFPEDTVIEYLCTAQYNPAGEACISPLAPDIDWSLCDPALKEIFDRIVLKTDLMSDRDRHGLTLEAWLADPRAEKVTYSRICS